MNFYKDKNRVDHLDKYAADKYRRDSRREKSSALSEFPELKDYKPNIQVAKTTTVGFGYKVPAKAYFMVPNDVGTVVTKNLRNRTPL